METPVFFRNGTYNLFGVIHSPVNNNAPFVKHNLGIVYCHPFTEEKLVSHRVMVNLIRRMTEVGIHCLRFDFMGNGDSDGNFEDSTVDAYLSDIECAKEFLIRQTGVERIGLLGLRFGATLSALCYAKTSGIELLALIAPIVEGKTYIEHCLRANLTTQLALYKQVIKDRQGLIEDLIAGNTVNIEGYLLTNKLYQQICGINLLNEKLTGCGKALLLQVSRNKNTNIDNDLSALLAKYKSNSIDVQLITVQEEYFWTDTRLYKSNSTEVQDALLGWLERLLDT